MKPLVLVMGVSGAGKSTVGTLLAARLGAPFADADAFHPPANIAKMTQTGCRPMFSPTIFGARMLPSVNCPNRKMPTTVRIHFQSGQNCATATLVPMTKPVIEPT